VPLPTTLTRFLGHFSYFFLEKMIRNLFLTLRYTLDFAAFTARRNASAVCAMAFCPSVWWRFGVTKMDYTSLLFVDRKSRSVGHRPIVTCCCYNGCCPPCRIFFIFQQDSARRYVTTLPCDLSLITCSMRFRICWWAMLVGRSCKHATT